MAVRIEGIPDPSNLTTYSVTEDATGLDPSTPSGGFGQIQFTAVDWPNSKMLSRNDITVVDSVHGRITGTVQNVTPDGVTVSVVGDSELGKFNARRVAQPFSGKMSEYVQYLMDLSGLYATLDYQAPDYTIHVPGFMDNVWERIKLLMSAHQLELTLVGDVVVVREPLLVESTLANAVSLSTTVNRQTSSLAVDVRYYNYRPITKGEVYPVKGEEPAIQTVEAGETIEFELNINASLSKVYQPVPSLAVGPGDRSGTEGVYTIVGQDNLPIMPAQWKAAGGRLDVFLTDEPGILRCVLMGAQIPHLAPFRIAESAGGTDYNSLHITGDGVAWEANAVRLYTGADPKVAAEEVGVEVDNPYISTPSQAVATGAITAAAHSGADVVIEGTLARADDHPQAFGNLIGSRVYHDGAFYRIETTNYAPGGVSFRGSMATTIADFNKVWEDKSQAYFNDTWAEYDAGQFSLQPLHVAEPVPSGTAIPVPLDQWELSGGAVYDPEEGVIILTSVGSKAVSPWVRVDMPARMEWVEEWWIPAGDNTTTNPDRRLVNLRYGDMDQQQIGSNGNARALPFEEWAQASYSLSSETFGAPVWARWEALVSTVYGTPGMKFRNPRLIVTR